MRSLKRALALTTLSMIFVFSLATSAVAQYGNQVGSLAAYIATARTSTERPGGQISFVIPGTRRLTTNLLRSRNGNPLPKDVYRQVNLTKNQRFLVVSGRLPLIAGTSAIFALEGASKRVVTRVAARGQINASLPVRNIPRGSYYVTLNGVRIAIVNAR